MNTSNHQESGNAPEVSKLLDKSKGKKAQSVNYPVRPRLLSLRQAAQYLGVTGWQMRTLAWNGVIPVVQFPNGWKKYFDIDDLDEVIRRNKITN